MATQLNFRPRTTSQLAELTQLNCESATGFREAAEHFEDGIIVCELRDMADQRERQAAAITEFVPKPSDKPCQRGSYRAVFRRYWQDARNQFFEGADHEILSSMEQAEDYCLSAYENLLESVSGTQLTELLMIHIDHIKLDREMLKELRDYVHES